MSPLLRPRRPQRPRDSQRARLYRAEREAFDVYSEATPRLDFAAVERFVSGVIGEPWFAETFGTLGAVRIKDGRGTRHAYSAYDQRRHGVLFSFPRWSRSVPVLLHEIAHPASLRRHGLVAAHGPEFAAAYLALIARHVGDEDRARLAEAFARHRVRCSV